MPSPDPAPSRPSPRLWLVLAGILLGLALVTPWPLPSPDKAKRDNADPSANTVIPSKTYRATNPLRERRSKSALPSRTWNVPADFVDYLHRLRFDPNGSLDDPFSPRYELISEVDPFAPDIDPFAPDIDPFAPDDFVPTPLPHGHSPPLTRLGVTFPPGASVELDTSTGRFEVHNTPDNLDLINEIIAAIGPMPMWTLDPSLFQTHDPPPDPRIEINTEKLKKLIIPEVDFAGTTVEEAIDFLNQRSRELDPEGQGVHIRLRESPIPTNTSASNPRSPDIGSATIRELRLRNAPLATVLQYLCDSSAIRYHVDEDGVALLMLTTSAPPPLPVTREWHVDPALMERLRFPPFEEEHLIIDPFASDQEIVPIDEATWRRQRAQASLTDLLKDHGISFPPKTEVHYSARSSTLTLTTHPSNLVLAESLFLSLAIDESKERAGF